ncbi:MAG TPA: Mur ligase family protein [Turneriella sp.]|nr:Mur ligase family protein [Turneriella sp.]
MRLPPDPAPVEAEILQFFADRNFERSRRFSGNAYDPAILRDYLATAGNPQFGFRAIHVAGTVGKGSATTMLARALSAMGFRTGAYLSPHFVSLTERFVIDDEPISPAALEIAWQKLRANGGLESLSFFDAMTALGFLYFAEAGCDFAVIETGLGGRLDSTNNLRAEAAVLTTIGMDHMNILGDTLTAIATEKAGIIHPGQKVYSLPQEGEALRVIEARCREVGAALTVIQPTGEDFTSRNRDFILQLLGLHFAPREAERSLCRSAIEAPIFGRWSQLTAQPRVFFDGAHNAAGIGALCELVNRQPESECNIFLNTMRERDLGAFGQMLLQQINKKVNLYLFPMPGDNYYPEAPQPLSAADDTAIRQLVTEPQKLHLFTGSMGLYAELRRRFAL